MGLLKNQDAFVAAAQGPGRAPAPSATWSAGGGEAAQASRLGVHNNGRSNGRSNSPPATLPAEFIERVKDRADILSIIGARVELKRSGSGAQVGLCPFHGEKSPSFVVTESRRSYHCFGCGAHGDAIAFLMEFDGLPFRSAIEEAARTCGLSLPVPATEPNAPPSKPTGPLYDVNSKAMAFYQAELARQEPAAIVSKYLKKRGLTQESIDRFAIGYAPQGWQPLARVFNEYERLPALEDAGLTRDKESPEGRRRFDFFRDRLIFPVRDGRGRVIAFGGRHLDDGSEASTAKGPKYLNTAETAIFQKSNALYGFLEAREAIRKHKMALVVEGYMDVVMLSQYGVGCAVACMGTAMTRSHLERLLTQTDTIVFSFDGDGAGRRAAERTLETLLPLVEDKHDLRFMLLPGGKDPDEMVRQQGAQAYLDLVRTAPSLSEFMLQSARERCNSLKSVEDRARFAADAASLASNLNPRTNLRKLLLGQIAAEAQVPGSALQDIRRQSARERLRADRSIWRDIRAAAEQDPVTALQMRPSIMASLDLEAPDESELAAALNGLDGQKAVTSGVAANPAALAEGGSGSGPEKALAHARLCARDTLLNSVALITAHREEQLLRDLKLALQAGEINEAQYLQMCLQV